MSSGPSTLKPVDIVIVGLGWAGGIVAKELADTQLKHRCFRAGRAAGHGA